MRRLAADETLWDAAKQYRTDEELIRAVNQLTEGEVPDKMLLIPVCARSRLWVLSRAAGFAIIEYDYDRGGERTMRVLATIGFSFSTGVFLAALLPWDGWQLYAAAGAGALLALVWLLAARRSVCFRRGLLILLPLAVSLAYFAGYRYLVQRPVEQRCGTVSPFTATVCDWPQETERGCRITVKLDGYPGARAVLVRRAGAAGRPAGQHPCGHGAVAVRRPYLQQRSDPLHGAGRIRSAVRQGGRAAVRGSEGALRWLPQRAAKAFRERIAAVWDDPRVSGFLTAELTGDKSAMDEGTIWPCRRRVWRTCSPCPACTVPFW